jgi:hypothetical protein
MEPLGAGGRIAGLNLELESAMAGDIYLPLWLIPALGEIFLTVENIPVA